MSSLARASTAAVAAFFAVALLPRATWPLIDPDVWWHIRAGETVLSSGGIPRADSWSLTAAGHPWTSQDWLSNVLLALGWRLGPWGETLLSLASAGIVVGAFVLLWWAVSIRRPAVGWLARVGWFSAALLLAGPVLGVRVQVVDLALASAVLLLLWRYLADERRVWVAMLPVVSVVWANLHAGFPILFAFGGAVLVGETVDRAMRRRADSPALGWSSLGWLGAALVVALMALVLNPNGIDIYRYPFDTVNIGALADFVGEWQPARLNSLFGWLVLGFIVLGVVPTLVMCRRSMRTADALILVGVSVMSVLAVRFLLITGPIGAAIIAVNLAPAISATRIGRRMAPVLAGLDRPRRGLLGRVNAALTISLVLIGIGLAVARAVPAAQSQAIAEEFPVGAVEWMKGNAPAARVFNRYEWGGYLGLERSGEPIFIDGRADVYGDAVIREYVSVIGLEGDPQAVLDRHAIDVVLYPPGTALAVWLDEHGWSRSYEDSTAAVWTRVRDKAQDAVGTSRAGTPTTVTPGRTESLTRLAAPTTAPEPMVTPCMIVAPEPIQASASMDTAPSSLGWRARTLLSPGSECVSTVTRGASVARSPIAIGCARSSMLSGPTCAAAPIRRLPKPATSRLMKWQRWMTEARPIVAPIRRSHQARAGGGHGSVRDHAAM